MLVTRTSQYSGKQRTMDLPITDEQVARYNGGELIQRAFPDCTAAQREFYKTGITDEEWSELFPPED